MSPTTNISPDALKSLLSSIKESTSRLIDAIGAPARGLTLVPGDEVRGEVLEQRPNGRFFVNLGGSVLDMNLPVNTRVGTTVQLTFVSDQPRLTFALPSPSSQGAKVELSDAGRWLGQISGSSSNATGSADTVKLPKLFTTLPADTKVIADRLRETVVKSGLFYESHLSRWAEGSFSLDDLLSEPQGQLSERLQKDSTPSSPFSSEKTAENSSTAGHPSASVKGEPATVLTGRSASLSHPDDAFSSKVRSSTQSQPTKQETQISGSQSALREPLQENDNSLATSSPGRVTSETSSADFPQTREAPVTSRQSDQAGATVPNRTIGGDKSTPSAATTHSATSSQQTEKSPAPLPGQTLPASDRELLQRENSVSPSHTTSTLQSTPPPTSTKTDQTQVNQQFTLIEAATEEGIQAQSTGTPAKPAQQPDRHQIPPSPLPFASGSLQESDTIRSKGAPGGERSSIGLEKGIPVKPEPADSQTLPLIKQQLSTLYSGQFVWQGEAWQGQPMEWKINQQNKRRNQTVPRTYETSLRLELPMLGAVSAAVRLLGNQVQISFKTASDDVQKVMQHEKAKLQEGLSDAGLQLTSMEVHRAESS